MRWQSVSPILGCQILTAAWLSYGAFAWCSLFGANMCWITSDSMQVVRRRSYTHLRNKVAARAFVAKPGLLACLQRTASMACKMQASLARTTPAC